MILEGENMIKTTENGPKSNKKQSKQFQKGERDESDTDICKAILGRKYGRPDGCENDGYGARIP